MIKTHPFLATLTRDEHLKSIFKVLENGEVKIKNTPARQRSGLPKGDKSSRVVTLNKKNRSSLSIDTINGVQIIRADISKGGFEGLNIGGQRPRAFLSTEKLRRYSERGIPVAALEPFAKFLKLNKLDIAEYIDLDRSTIARRQSIGGLLPRHSSENVLRMLEIENMVSETFEDADTCAWLHKKHPMLDGETPFSAAKTAYGAQQVKDLLLSIKYGGVL